LLGLRLPLHHRQHAIILFHLQQTIERRHPIEMLVSQCTKALNVLFYLRQLRIEGGNFVFTTKADNGPQQIIT
jgi:hypothetical protein